MRGQPKSVCREWREWPRNKSNWKIFFLIVVTQKEEKLLNFPRFWAKFCPKLVESGVWGAVKSLWAFSGVILGQFFSVCEKKNGHQSMGGVRKLEFEFIVTGPVTFVPVRTSKMQLEAGFWPKWSHMGRYYRLMTEKKAALAFLKRPRAFFGLKAQLRAFFGSIGLKIVSGQSKRQPALHFLAF